MLSVLRKTDEDGRVKDQQSTANLAIQILGYNKEVKTKAMNWGLMNEPLARKRYKTISQKCHTNFSVTETGLVLSVDWPLAAQALMPLCIVLAAGQGLPSSKSLGHTGKKQ